MFIPRPPFCLSISIVGRSNVFEKRKGNLTNGTGIKMNFIDLELITNY